MLVKPFAVPQANLRTTSKIAECNSHTESPFLPPAYVVRREGNVLTRVCLSVHRGVLNPRRTHGLSTPHPSRSVHRRGGTQLGGYSAGGVLRRGGGTFLYFIKEGAQSGISWNLKS